MQDLQLPLGDFKKDSVEHKFCYISNKILILKQNFFNWHYKTTAKSATRSGTHTTKDKTNKAKATEIKHPN